MSRKVYLARLREIRLDREISKSEMTEKIDVTLVTYDNYETGAGMPPFEKVVKIADILGVSLDYLIGRDTDGRMDATLLQACNYTGLSPQAVRCLHKSRGFKIKWREKREIDTEISRR